MSYLEDGKQSGEVSALPQILLLGDSIRIGYCGTVKKQLDGMYDVRFPNENCQYTQHTFVSLSFWKELIGPSPAAVHFNCGHWDIAHWDGEKESLNTVEEYGKMLVRIVERIKKLYPSTKIFFATTTPMNPNGKMGVNPRSTEEIKIYNAEAKRVLTPLGVKINDLFGITKDLGEEAYTDYCHFTDEIFRLLGRKTAEFLIESI